MVGQVELVMEGVARGTARSTLTVCKSTWSELAVKEVWIEKEMGEAQEEALIGRQATSQTARVSKRENAQARGRG